MNYEKAYKDALERAKKLYEQGTITESLSYVFPELKESEDERIRKVLIDLVKCNERSGYTLLNNVTTDSILAWLEKQALKPKWTEEDVIRLDRICKTLWKNRKGDTDEIFQQEQDVEWLKSLKDRAQPQPKQEWSEEDSKVIDNCCLLIAAVDDSYEKAFKDDCIHYLQNLKQRMGV